MTSARKGRILRSTSQGYLVHLEDGSSQVAMRRKNLDVKKGLIWIGDEVTLDGQGQIADILPRKNFLSRPRACNLDMAGVIVSAKEPSFSSFLLDKYLTSCAIGSVPSYVILSKCDLLSEEELSSLRARMCLYEKIGYSVFFTGIDRPKEDRKIEAKIAGKVSVFMGQTGVGKSSLINRLDASFHRPIGAAVIQGRGAHQTKEVAFLPFLGGYLGDTPGFSDFSLSSTKGELSEDFPGFAQYSKGCRFKGCYHDGIKGCAVEEAVKEGSLSLDSYRNYRRLLSEAEEERGYERRSTHREWRKKR